MSIAEGLGVCGERWYGALEESFRAADERGLVAPRSRVLCAALGALATEAARALGASARDAEAAGLAGAALSLLSKLDDEVIDSLAFHGGPASARDDVEARTRAFLAPTLDAVRAGARAETRSASSGTDAARRRFALDVGARLRALAGDAARLEHVLDAIALGWDVQAKAARVLTAAPASVGREEVLAATRSISGAWLGMITLVGELPPSAARAITRDEVDAIWDWGSFIQRADALCDLEKDQRAGLGSTFVGREARRAASSAPAPSTAELYRAVATHDLDLACVPSEAERAGLRARLAPLGGVEPLLGWIFAMLFRRYLEHPLAARNASFGVEGATCSAP